MGSSVPVPSLLGKTPSAAFKSATAPSNLKRIYRDHVEEKGAHGRDGVHPAALAKDIDSVAKLVSRKMRAGTYRFTGYRELLESKGAGKAPRVLSIPTARDRIALKALANCLGDLFPKTRGVMPHQRVDEVAAAINSGVFDSFVKLDVENFYPSIDHRLIEQSLRSRIRKTEVIEAVLAAVRTPTVPTGQRSRIPNRRGVPQGLALSNTLAELVMQEVDDAISASVKCAYFRYVDDILILCDKASSEILRDTVVKQCRKIGLKVHVASKSAEKSGSGEICNGFSYLGYTFNDKVISVRDRSIRNVQASLARAFTRYKRDSNYSQLQGRVNIIVTGCIYGGVSYGWLNYFRQMTDLTVLKRLDVTIEKMKRRYGVPFHFRNKSFVRAYWSLRHPFGKNQHYIPDFDTANMPEMRKLLAMHLGEKEADEIPDSDVPAAFRRIMRKVVIDLDRDIAHIS